MTDLLRPPTPAPQAPRPEVPVDRGNPIRLLILGGLLVLAGLRGGWSLLVMIAALVVMIFLHELGHFITAKRAGMKVTEFFIGFGPRIWSYRRGETEYGLKAIPAGAYVRIIGMSNLEEVPQRRLEERVAERVRRGRQPLRVHALAGQEEVVRHLAEREARRDAFRAVGSLAHPRS